MRGVLRKLALMGAALAAALPAVSAVAAPSSDATFGEQLYLVTMVGPGTAGYQGDYSAADYRTGLLQRQDAALAVVGAEPVQRWTTALSGFAVHLDPLAADRLRSLPGVQLVERDVVRRLAAAAPTAPTLGRGTGGDGGRGVVIGFVDSGLHTRGPVFADSPTLGRMPRRFTGSCPEAEAMCNRKVVAARAFVEAFGADRLRSGSSLGPQDDQGHGTMVASLAAGNRATPTGPARHVSRRFAGAAPDARVAVYKACWEAPDPEDDGCATADVVSAIDAAVADGVDVLNLSVAGSPGLDTVDLATLGAAESDVVVIAAAGNDGRPTGHDVPWVTTVGAARIGNSAGSVHLSGGARLPGTLSPRPLAEAAPVTLARDLAAPGASRDAAAQCRQGTLDAARTDGRIVVCQRGEGARLEKSTTVRLAGGNGMVLVNGPRDALTVDLHAIPTVNVSAKTGRQLRRALAEGPVRARLIDANGQEDRPRVLPWSDRGRRTAEAIKPDLVAPGLGLIAASSPSAERGSWDLLSGTSASAALTSGVAAALRQRHQGWPAARIRSALTTSTRPIGGDLTRAGSGLLDARAAARTTLVQDLPATHYRAFLDGERSQLNTTSGAASGGGVSVLRRSLTNAGSRAGYWSVQAHGFRHHTVEVFPRAVRLAPGESHRVRIRISGRGPAEQGFVVWRDDAGRLLRMPLQVR
ncbi:S8 family serine peptidase [Nocardioides daejeonensis]|uniref:S8 family serine peptidase n=1 Tax=Nocardioides daejeonensis TaxID=1046556 RepID=UPI000D7485F2|nr:S8 family serine peptidase [Nocardioides daejeonensis]